MNRAQAANVLGILLTATHAEAKKAYRKKALKLHPDKDPAATEAFQELSEAYATFSKPAKVVVAPTPLSPFHFDTRTTFVL